MFRRKATVPALLFLSLSVLAFAMRVEAQAWNARSFDGGQQNMAWRGGQAGPGQGDPRGFRQQGGPQGFAGRHQRPRPLLHGGGFCFLDGDRVEAASMGLIALPCPMPRQNPAPRGGSPRKVLPRKNGGKGEDDALKGSKEGQPEFVGHLQLGEERYEVLVDEIEWVEGEGGDRLPKTVTARLMAPCEPGSGSQERKALGSLKASVERRSVSQGPRGQSQTMVLLSGKVDVGGKAGRLALRVQGHAPQGQGGRRGMQPRRQGGFGRGQQGFGRGQQGFGRGQQGFGPPQQGYGPPQQGHGPPQQGFGPPQQGHGPPQQGFGPPQQGFGPPQQGFGPPQQGFGPPQQGFGPPQQGHGPPQRANAPSQGW